MAIPTTNRIIVFHLLVRRAQMVEELEPPTDHKPVSGGWLPGKESDTRHRALPGRTARRRCLGTTRQVAIIVRNRRNIPFGCRLMLARHGSWS